MIQVFQIACVVYSLSPLDIDWVLSNKILPSDIQNVLKVVALREFRASGPQHYQHFMHIFTCVNIT